MYIYIYILFCPEHDVKLLPIYYFYLSSKLFFPFNFISIIIFLFLLTITHHCPLYMFLQFQHLLYLFHVIFVINIFQNVFKQFFHCFIISRLLFLYLNYNKKKFCKFQTNRNVCTIK